MCVYCGEYDIMHMGEVRGRLRASCDGRRVTASSVCRPEDRGIYRVYLICGDEAVSAGVLMPNGLSWVAQKSYLFDELKALGIERIEGAVLDTGEPGARRVFADERLNRLLLRENASYDREKRIIKIPFDPGKRFPVEELFCLAEIVREGDSYYALYRVDSEGRPTC